MVTLSIPLHSRKYPGLFALIDEEDYERVSVYRWHPSKGANTWYAATNIPLGNGRYRYVKMHRFLMQPPDSLDVDHVNGDGLRNTRENMRVSTRKQNSANSGARKQNQIGYRGVSLHLPTSLWRAQMRIENKSHHLGLYQTPEDAARIYDAKALETHGVFAKLNFPDTQNAPSTTLGNFRRDNTKGYRGVYFHRLAKVRKWQAKIGHNKKYVSLGYFETIEEAAHAYDIKARELFGERAVLNFAERR